MDAGPTFFRNATSFRKWLEKNSADAPFLLVGFHRVGSNQPCMKWEEAVDEALCFGWIDGVRKRIDERSYSIRFSPRRKTSIWSAVNLANVERLMAEGRMKPAGLEAYQHRSEARSKVYAYEQTSPRSWSDQQRAEFESCSAAWDFFMQTPLSYQRTMMHWVQSAKKPETVHRRLQQLIHASAQQQRMRGS